MLLARRYVFTNVLSRTFAHAGTPLSRQRAAPLAGNTRRRTSRAHRRGRAPACGCSVRSRPVDLRRLRAVQATLRHRPRVHWRGAGVRRTRLVDKRRRHRARLVPTQLRHVHQLPTRLQCRVHRSTSHVDVRHRRNVGRMVGRIGRRGAGAVGALQLAAFTERRNARGRCFGQRQLRRRLARGGCRTGGATRIERVDRRHRQYSALHHRRGTASRRRSHHVRQRQQTRARDRRTPRRRLRAGGRVAAPFRDARHHDGLHAAPRGAERVVAFHRAVRAVHVRRRSTSARIRRCRSAICI